MASTKEGYQEEFKSFTLALALVIVLPSTRLGAFSGFLSALGDSSLGFLACYATFIALAYSIGITIDCLIPYQLKDWLIYPRIGRFGISRPGSTIFSDLRSGRVSDCRFSASDALEIYSSIIDRLETIDDQDIALRFQNAQWYRLYRKHAQLESVQSANRAFLYGRDLCALPATLSLLMAAANCLTLCAGGYVLFARGSIVVCVAFALVGSISARLKGKRLVTSVIACDVSETISKEHR